MLQIQTLSLKGHAANTSSLFWGTVPECRNGICIITLIITLVIYFVAGGSGLEVIVVKTIDIQITGAVAG